MVFVFGCLCKIISIHCVCVSVYVTLSCVTFRKNLTLAQCKSLDRQLQEKLNVGNKIAVTVAEKHNNQNTFKWLFRRQMVNQIKEAF